MAPKRLKRGLVLAYVGEDETFRESIMELDPFPDDLELNGGRARGRWRVALEPGRPIEILMTAEPSIGGRRHRRRRRQTAAADLRRADAE